MIFAAATDEKSLFVFSTSEEAIAHCEGLDVEDGGWLFWDGAGTALNPEFLTANHRGSFIVGGGTYRLVPSRFKPPLAGALTGLRNIDPNPYFSTLADVREHLATASSVPQDGA